MTLAPARPRVRLVTEAQQTLIFTRRTLAIGALQGAIGLLLAGRMGWLAIVEHDHFEGLAEANRARSTLIPPRRGWIVDRAGKPIAINRSDFRVDLIPDLLGDRAREIALLRSILDLGGEDVRRLHDALDAAAGFQPVQVAEDMDYERFARVSLRLPDLPGVLASRGFSRLYPDGAAVAHLVGYVGSASAEDYKQDRDPLLITPGFKIGKQGLEKVFERRLRGTPGAKRAEVTARGRLVRDLTTLAETPGATLQLTVDAGLQRYIAERMGIDSGSCVVIDTANGDILAMVSMPAFDPNRFSHGVSHDEWAMLAANDHLPLVNKVLQGLYPAGSTVKPVNALALLEAGVSPDDAVVCTGAYRVGTTAFHCWRHHGHGSISMHRAIQQSCDIYFFQMARRVGTGALAAMARRMGLGERFPLPVSSQRFGTVPEPAWKLKRYHADWTVSDTLNSAIGQGYTLVNPLQIAVMAARIASGSRLIPRLVRRKDDRPPEPLGIAPEHLAIVRAAMRDVVNAPGGTAGSARLPIVGIEMGGKTGSAQVRHISAADRVAGRTNGAVGAWSLRDHGLFVAFAPVVTPRYAVGLILEHAGHGTAAAAIARDALTYLYDRDKALATLTTLQRGWGGDIAARMTAERAAWQGHVAARRAMQATRPPEDQETLDEEAQPPATAAASAVAPPAEDDADQHAPTAARRVER